MAQNLVSRFAAGVRSLMWRWSRQLANADEAGEHAPFDWDWDLRREKYKEWALLHANEIYNVASDGGSRELILEEIIGREENSDEALGDFFNPIREICDAYQNIFRGVWGQDFWPMSADGDDALATDDPLYVQLFEVWKQSNLDTQKQVLQTYGPLYGTVGLRIAADPETKTARIQIDHPGRIIDFSEDDDGNVTEVLLEYVELIGPLGKERKISKVRDLLTVDRITRTRDDAEEFSIPNELGVCPYVIIRHIDTGGEFGAPAFFGSENLMHRINWRYTRSDQCIDENEFPRWFMTGAGAAPEEFDLSGRKIAYVRTAKDQPVPTATPLVPTIQHESHQKFIAELKDNFKARQPELNLTDLKTLAGQSGETIAQLLKPVAQRIELARSNYENGMIRAMKIALAWRARMGAGDSGTGSGSLNSALAIFNNPATDFTFNKRSPLPLSPFDLIKEAESETARRKRDIEDAAAADFVSERERLRIAGYTEAEIDEIETEKSEQDVIPTADGGDAGISNRNGDPAAAFGGAAQQ